MIHIIELERSGLSVGVDLVDLLANVVVGGFAGGQLPAVV